MKSGEQLIIHGYLDEDGSFNAMYEGAVESMANVLAGKSRAKLGDSVAVCNIERVCKVGIGLYDIVPAAQDEEP